MTKCKIDLRLVTKQLVEILEGNKDRESIDAIIKERFDRYGVNYGYFYIRNIEYHEDGNFTSFIIDYDCWEIVDWYDITF